MNYIYYVVLNFNKHYCEFFEWKKTDKIMNVKKIPTFKVSCDDLRDLKFNEIKLNKKFIDKIFQLTLFYNKKDNYDYMCLVSSCNEAIGLMFDKEGNIIKRSSLVFDEEEEVKTNLFTVVNMMVGVVIKPGTTISTNARRYKKMFDAAQEDLRNAYEEACSRYLDGKVDKERFKRSYPKT